MNNPRPIKFRVLDLFSGIGGFSLGLERTEGFETVAFCEIDSFCQKVLKKHWPDVPIYTDIKALDYLPSIDVITGGFPCQAFSTAARGRNTAPDLWPDMLRVIKGIRPSFVIAENVQEKPIQKAKSDLENLGYVVTIKRIGADEAGADHQRNRWWLCAHAYKDSKFHIPIDAEASKLPELCEGIWGAENYARAIRVPDGLPDRIHRVGSLGNSVLPFIPEMYGYAILASHELLESGE